MNSPAWCSDDAAANTAIIPPKTLHQMLKIVEEGRQKKREQQQCATNQTQEHATQEGDGEKEGYRTSCAPTDVWTLSEETATFLSEIFSEELLDALRTTHKSALNRIESRIATAPTRGPHATAATTRNAGEAKPVQTRLPYSGAVVSPRIVEAGPVCETEKSFIQPDGRDSKSPLASQPNPYVLTLSDTWRQFAVPAGTEEASVALAPALMAATANHRFILGPISHFKKHKDRARTPQGNGRESGLYSPALGATAAQEAEKRERDGRPASRPTAADHARSLDRVEAGDGRR